MGAYRGFLIPWGTGIVVVLGAFLLFAYAIGWPGKVNDCVNQTPNGCYCEAFNLTEAESSNPHGVQQPVNTWFNLYAIGTSLWVAIFVFLDRSNGTGHSNLISSKESWIPDLFIFAVLFLGLGSMWFHASIKQWGGLTDQLSMFVFTAFLVSYSLRRLWQNDWAFWIGYLLLVVIFTWLAAVITYSQISLVLILILVGMYLVFELVANGKSATPWWWSFSRWRWLVAVGCIAVATVSWALSQTDGPLCFDKGTSAFQPHGLIWHPFAGFMAVFLYHYWRQDVDGPQEDTDTQIPWWASLIMAVVFVGLIAGALAAQPTPKEPVGQSSSGLQQKAKPQPRGNSQPTGTPHGAPAPKRH